MAFALSFIGVLFIVTGFQDTYKQFFTEVEGDFTGPDSFIYWLAAIGGVGSLGYVSELKTFSRATMALIILTMFLANKGGVFKQFTTALSQGSATPVNAPGDALPANSSSNSGSTAGASSSTINQAGSVIGSILGGLFSG